MQPNLEAKSDHDLLILAVQELQHVKAHLAVLAEKAEIGNGRLAALERVVERLEAENIPSRLTALEHWRTGLAVVLSAWSVGWPFLIFEFRQWFLEKFGFIVGG